MNNLVNLVKNKVQDYLEELGYQLYHVEYVNELGHFYLRITIMKHDTNEKITIKDCEVVSKNINKLIDDVCDGSNKFFLEVCSPGINRKLYTVEHMKQVIGKIVCVKLNKSLNGTRKYLGILDSVDDKQIKLKTKDDEFKIDIDLIKSMNLEEISQEDIHE